MTDRAIIPRSTIGAPLPGSRPRLAGSLLHLLCHYTGAGKYDDPTKDLAYAKSVAAYGISAGKPYEYNYLIGLGGSIFEQAGDRVGAHCLNFNTESIGVLMMLSPGVQPTPAMIDSFRWLRHHLIESGALHLASDAVPHYRYRTTACCGPTLAEAPGPKWSSPTHEGSLGDLHDELLMPWQDAPVPSPPSATPGEREMLIKNVNDPAVYLAIPANIPEKRILIHIAASDFEWAKVAYGPLIETTTDLHTFGRILA